MNRIAKSAFILTALTGAVLAGTAQAQSLTVIGSDKSSPGSYAYNYVLTPSFNTTLLTVSFNDPNISGVSIFGSLSAFSQTSPGSFVFFSATGGTLTAGSTETFVFSSPDAPGSFVNMAAVGPTGGAGVSDVTPAPAAVPSAVPEASTTVSFGLLLMLGLSGAVVAARKKIAQSAA